MISILAQERLLGAALGSVFAGVVIFEQRRDIYKTIAQNQPPKSQERSAVSKRITERLNSLKKYHGDLIVKIVRPQGPKMKEPIHRKKFEFAHYWNKSVDQIFGPAIQALSSRKW